MKQIFDWLREQIEENSVLVMECYTNIISSNMARILVDEAEAKWESDIVNQTAMMYAVALTKYGVDIREKFETATQITMALNEAYLRGRRDERIKISEVGK